MRDETESAEFERDDASDFVGFQIEFDRVVDLDFWVDVSQSSAVVSHFRLKKF